MLVGAYALVLAPTWLIAFKYEPPVRASMIVPTAVVEHRRLTEVWESAGTIEAEHTLTLQPPSPEMTAVVRVGGKIAAVTVLFSGPDADTTVIRCDVPLATRRALGATSRDLLMMLIIEQFVIGMASGLLGVAIASYALVVSAAIGSQLFQPIGFGAVLVAAFLPAAAAAFLAALPMWWASRTDPAIVFRSSAE